MIITLEFKRRLGEDAVHIDEIEHPHSVSIVSVIQELKERADGGGWPPHANLVTATCHGHPLFRVYKAYL